MPINVKPIGNVVSKWKTNAGNAAPAYSQGIANPKQPQEQAAANAANTWGAGVQAAVSNGSFVKGINKNAGKWARNAAAKGAARYPQGIAAASGDFQNGIAPYLQILSNLTLPPRAPKGDPSNLQRVQAVDAALRAAKLQGAS